MRTLLVFLCVMWLFSKSVFAFEEVPPFKSSVKVSALPLVLCWTMTQVAEVSYELKIKNQFSYGGGFAFVYPSPFIRIHDKTRGYYFLQEGRRYLKDRIFFIGFNLTAGSSTHQGEYLFENQNGTYEKMVEQRRLHISPHFTSGLQIPFKNSGFFLDAVVGVGAQFSKNQLGPLDETEIDQLQVVYHWKNWKGLNFTEVLPSLYFGLNIGYRFGD
ncbi:MAG: hypothetical protein IPO32_11410 [Crocinitomicaceae bacterium]|nr:hypothetical protein [Crocinitomicaceae bacterium]